MNPRGKTKVSQFSRQSTYLSNLPEGSSLTHLDDLKPDSALFGEGTFVSALDATVPSGVKAPTAHGVRFENASRNNSAENVPTVPKHPANLSQEALRQRLYHPPQKNVAVKVIRNQEAHAAMALKKTVSSLEELEKQVCIN